MATSKMVKVDWEDSVLHDGGWVSAAHISGDPGLTMCHTIGYLVRSTRKHLTIASSKHAENVSGVTIIPRSAVRKMVALSEPA